jgi:hypothetical protein
LAVAAHTTACTNSYKYVGGAISAIKDYNDNHSGTGVADAGGGTVLLIAGNYDLSSGAYPTISAMQNTWVNIQPLSTITDNTSVVVNARAGTNFMKANGKYHFKNLTVNSTGGYDMGAAGAITAHLWVDNLNYAAVGTGPHFGIRHRYMTNCTIASGVAATSFSYGVTLSNWRLMRGNNAAHPAASAGKNAHPYAVLGNAGLIPYSTCCKTGNAAGLQTPDGGIWAYNSNLAVNATSLPIANFGKITQYDIGYAIVQNLWERIDSGSQTAGAFANDGCTATTNNIMFWHNTWIGERVNAGYNDSGATAYLHKNWKFVGNLGYVLATKGDAFGGALNVSAISKAAAAVFTSNSHTFVIGSKVYIEGGTGEYAALNGNTYTVSAKDTNTFTTDCDTSAMTNACSSGCGTAAHYNPARTGNWPVQYRIGYYSNVIHTVGYLTDVCTGSPPWFGSTPGMYSPACGTDTFTFARDTTTKTGDSSAVAGKYDPITGASALSIIPSGKAVLPYDIAGHPRRNDGTGAAGAYEYRGKSGGVDSAYKVGGVTRPAKVGGI